MLTLDPGKFSVIPRESNLEQKHFGSEVWIFSYRTSLLARPHITQ